MDPQTARPTNSSAREKTSGQHGISQVSPFCHARIQSGLTCVVHDGCYLAFSLPVPGNNRIREFQESLQWAFMLTARDCQWKRFLPTLIPVKHLHRVVTENETATFRFVLLSPAEVIPSHNLSVHTLSFTLVVVFLLSLPLGARLQPLRVEPGLRYLTLEVKSQQTSLLQPSPIILLVQLK